MVRAIANFETSGINAILHEAQDKVGSLDKLVYRLEADVRDGSFADVDDAIQAVVDRLYEIKSLMAFAEQRSQSTPHGADVRDGQVVSVPGRREDGADTAWYAIRMKNGTRRTELLGTGSKPPKRTRRTTR
jgi:hypothetical protein